MFWRHWTRYLAAPTHPLPLQTAVNSEILSFGQAINGIWVTLRTERHLRIQVFIAAVAVALGLGLGMSPIEWAVLLLTATFVLVLEIVNTVVETLVDLVSPDVHPLAKQAKDASAGAVLVGACGSVAVGAVLFVPRIWGMIVH